MAEKMAETSNISTALATLYLPTTPAAERLAIEGNLELWKASDNSIKAAIGKISRGCMLCCVIEPSLETSLECH